MDKKKDNPGIVIPPPIIYLAVFAAGIFLQRIIPISKSFFKTRGSGIIGIVLIAISMVFGLAALERFFKTRNTVITVKPATSLQTGGIYSVTRNPMYVGVLFLYTGLTFLIGNWWNIILLPFLIWIIQGYVIHREEKYLMRRFGDDYKKYKTKVRRWI